MIESTEAALLRAIEVASGDDAPRLIYSDWLQENGRDREAARLRSDIAAPGLAVLYRDGELVGRVVELRRRDPIPDELPPRGRPATLRDAPTLGWLAIMDDGRAEILNAGPMGGRWEVRCGDELGTMANGENGAVRIYHG